jgi:hypothetical protein
LTSIKRSPYSFPQDTEQLWKNLWKTTILINV